ncbi:MAG: hypothetical protein IKR64_09895 [Treponema sp.]|nr:hypothetical protein [Treponema sp.]
MTFKNKFKFDSKPVRIFLLALCVLLTFIMYMQRRTRNYYKQAAKLAFYNVQPADLADGTYRGKVYTQFMHVQLDVSVAGGRFTKIEIIENEGAYGKKVAPILDQMIKENNSVVTAVKGEELASIVFIACVDDALFNGLPESRRKELKARNDDQ